MRDQYDISIVLPTRGRPNRLKSLLESIKKTTKFSDKIEIIIRVDNDEKDIYQKIKVSNLNYTFIYGPINSNMGKLNKDCIDKARGKIIFIINDDVIFQTHNWDIILKDKIKKFNTEIFLMYPDDGLKGKKLSTFPILNRDTLLQNPNLLPDMYKGSFIDIHLMDIFMEYNNGKNICFLKDILCQHNHYRKYKNLLDDTYLKRDRFADDSTFIKLSLKRKKLASRLKGETFKKNSMTIGYSIFYLLYGQSKLTWRLYLFAYMCARRVYSNLIKIKKIKLIS